MTFTQAVFWAFGEPLRRVGKTHTFWEIKDYIELKMIECNTKSLQELENLFTIVSKAFGGSKKGENSSVGEMKIKPRSKKELG